MTAGATRRVKLQSNRHHQRTIIQHTLQRRKDTDSLTSLSIDNYCCLSAPGRRVCGESVCRSRATGSHSGEDARARADEETATSQHRLSSGHRERGNYHTPRASLPFRSCEFMTVNYVVVGTRIQGPFYGIRLLVKGH